jgi:hypothetical protein
MTWSFEDNDDDHSVFGAEDIIRIVHISSVIGKDQEKAMSLR